MPLGIEPGVHLRDKGRDCNDTRRVRMTMRVRGRISNRVMELRVGTTHPLRDREDIIGVGHSTCRRGGGRVVLSGNMPW